MAMPVSSWRGSLVLAALVYLTSCTAPIPTQAPAADLAPSAPKAIPCPSPDLNNACKADTTGLIETYAAAMDGNYEAQRNTAYAFGGFSPFIKADAVQACAWRKVILQTRPDSSSFADDSQADQDCSKLDAGQLSQAEALAGNIRTAIDNGG